MSQQGMTIVSLEGEVLDMGDLEYIQGFVISGNYFQVSGNIDALAATIEYVPASGKTAFLIEAKITMNANPGATAGINQIVADLKIDTVTVSKAKIGTAAATFAGVREIGGAGFSPGNESFFSTLGKSLVGDGVKKIEIENVLDSGGGFAEMSGYLVDT